MLKPIYKKGSVVLGFFLLVFLCTTVTFAGNPASPILPSDNIQDPGDPGTAWGGCGPTDSNCYVTVISSQWVTTGSDIYYDTGNVGIGTTTPLYPLEIQTAGAQSDVFNINDGASNYFTVNAIGDGIVSIGSSAGASATNASGSNFIGGFAGWQATNASNSNFFGPTAGNQATNANNSNFFGDDAGTQAANANNSNFFGSSAGQLAGSAANSNFFGQSAGYLASSASYSNLFGYQAGKFFTGNNIGSNNIIIGTNISLPATTADAINLGGVLFGTGTYSTTTGNPSITPSSGGKIGIGTVSPTARLHLPAGTTTAGTAPLKFTSGTNLTAAEAGAMEWDGTNLFITQTSGPTTKTLAYTTDIPAGSTYIQNQFASAQTSSDFWISGSGKITTNLTVEPSALGVPAAFLTYQLTSANSGTSAGVAIISANNTADTKPVVVGQRARGTLSSMLDVQSGDDLFGLIAGGIVSGARQTPAEIVFVVDGAPSAGVIPTKISFKTGTNGGNRTQKMFIGSNGNVVVGNSTDPGYRFHVLNSTTAQTATNRVADFSNAGATFDTTAGALSSYGGYFSSTSTESAGGNIFTNIGLYTTASGADANYAAIFDQGFVGINNTTPGYALHVGSASVTDSTVLLRLQDTNSTCDFTADSGAPSCGSDLTLKKDITSLSTTDLLTKISALNPVSYRWLTEESTDQPQDGFIAQEVAQQFPGLVTDNLWIDGSTRKFLNIGGLMPYAIGAIKELNLKIIGIENFDQENNSFGEKLRGWFANASNRITRIFTGEICLTDPDGTSECINKSELTELKQLLNNQTTTLVTTPEPQPEPKTEPEIAPEPEPHSSPDPEIEIPPELVPEDLSSETPTL